jgi:hypothetical protein
MRRFSALKIFLLALGTGFIITGVFLDPILRGWENYRYPDAVYWQGMRLVPGKNQKITVTQADMLVFRIVKGPMARLTLYLHPEDGLTPQKMVKALCARDACNKVTFAEERGERAAANYRIGGEIMQILLIRPVAGSVWIEFKGPPEALQQFRDLIESVTVQLASRAPSGQSPPGT